MTKKLTAALLVVCMFFTFAMPIGFAENSGDTLPPDASGAAVSESADTAASSSASMDTGSGEAGRASSDSNTYVKSTDTPESNAQPSGSSDTVISDQPISEPEQDASSISSSTSSADVPANDAQDSPVFDAETAYAHIMALGTEEKITIYLDTLTDEELIALVEYLETQEITENSFPYLTAYLEKRFPPYVFPTCINDTAAAPLVQMVPPRRMMLKAPSAGGADNSGLETSKTVVKNSDGTYTLRLEAYATGATYTTETSKPTDIVLVLDTSGSMDDYMNVADKSSVANLDPKYAEYYKWNSLGWRDMRYQDGKWQYDAVIFGWTDCGNSWFGNAAGIKKINALKIAVDGFLDSTAANDGDNRVALVTYASGANTRHNLTTDYAAIKNTVWGLNANGATYADSGMSNAKAIIDGISADRDSNKVVIMFTDGEPNHGNGFDTNVANSTISTSKQMKDMGVTVYTIGVLEGANNADTSLPFNKYMNYVSSNYPNATSMTDGGTKYEHPDGGNYYLAADNLEALKEIFQNISSEVGGAANSKLDSTTVMKDIISDAFQLPDGANANNIRIYTADCTAINGDVPTFGPDQDSGLKASIGEDGRSINVTGFDYSANYVGKNTTTGVLHTPGKKLIVEIPIVERSGFLGGNEVLTNGAESAIYTGSGEMVQTFPVPNVDVEIENITVTAQDRNVYLLGALTAEQIKSGAAATVGAVSLDLTKPDQNYGLEAWQTEYVDIVVTYKDAKGNTVTNLDNLREDTTYTVEVVVSPKVMGSVDGKTGSDSGNINVFKPELTYKDSDVYYGDTVPADFSGNRVKTEWKHGDTLDSSVAMTGAAPALETTCTPDASKVADGKINTKQDIPVDVTVKLNDTDVTNHAAFVHQDCQGQTCTIPADKEFLLHVKTCQLTIAKQGGADGEPYVFNVYRDGAKYSEVTIVGNNRETIVELPVGTYTIQEDTGWSWRYDGPEGAVVTLSKENTSGEISCTNTKTENYWLNGYSAIVRNIFGIEGEKGGNA